MQNQGKPMQNQCKSMETNVKSMSTNAKSMKIIETNKCKNNAHQWTPIKINENQ